MQYRKPCGGLAESLAGAVEIEPTHKALWDHLKATSCEAFWLDDATLEVKYHGFDDRIDQETYMVLLNGMPGGFTDGPLEG